MKKSFKYLTLSVGLGNQMFKYAFCNELRARGLYASLFVNKADKKYGQQGYELKTIFDIAEFSSQKSILFLFFKTLCFRY